jgi:alginate O-acetyltransferase complex protein AlgI
LRRGYVLALSCAFYATWNPYLVLIPFALCGVMYTSAKVYRAHWGQSSQRALTVGIVVTIATLAIAKYRGFLIGNLAVLIPWLHPNSLPAVFLVGLPLGISFYSFEAISYLLDTRQDRIKSAKLMDLSLFIMFWPHLIAGPITRSRELIPQLGFDRPFETYFLYAGLDRLLLGLVQKNVIANGIGSWVDSGFLPKVTPLNTTVDNWFLAIAFGLQIYFDFSAYSNMAIGAARLLGVTLPENFRYPYHAITPTEFWSRWHMTLSRWIRDYLFFPLNASLKDRKLHLYVSLVGVMGLVGLWHGAGWGYVVWGLMHGTYLATNRLFEGVTDKQRSWLMRCVWRGLTLAAIIAAWVPFRAGTLTQAGIMLSSMFLRPSSGISFSINFYLVTVGWCCYCIAEPYLETLLQSLRALGEKSHGYAFVNSYVLRPLAYACALLLFMMFDDRDTQFIYFQF